MSRIEIVSSGLPIKPGNKSMRLTGDLANSNESALTPDFGEPLVNLYETATHLLAVITLSGVAPEDISISATDESVEIQCHRRREPHENEDVFCREERWFGRWQRKISWPKRVDQDSVQAQLREGLLTIFAERLGTGLPRIVPVVEPDLNNGG